MKNLYSSSCKTLMKEIKGDTDKWKEIQSNVHGLGKIILLKPILPKTVLCNPWNGIFLMDGKTEAHQKKVSIHRKNFGSFCYSTVWEREWTMAHQRLCERNDKNKVFFWAQFPWTLFWENKRAKSVWSGTTQT